MSCAGGSRERDRRALAPLTENHRAGEVTTQSLAQPLAATPTGKRAPRRKWIARRRARKRSRQRSLGRARRSPKFCGERALARVGRLDPLRRRRLAERLVERVARAAHGSDRIPFAPARQGLPKAADMHVDRALVDFGRLSPDAVEQLGAREHAAGLLEQVFEQAKLGGSKMDVARAAAHAS